MPKSYQDLCEFFCFCNTGEKRKSVRIINLKKKQTKKHVTRKIRTRSFSLLRIPPHHLQAHRRLAREPGDGRSAYHVLPKCPHDVPLGHTGRGPASPHRPPPHATALSCSLVGLDTQSPGCHERRGCRGPDAPLAKPLSQRFRGRGGEGGGSRLRGGHGVNRRCPGGTRQFSQP